MRKFRCVLTHYEHISSQLELSKQSPMTRVLAVLNRFFKNRLTELSTPDTLRDHNKCLQQ
jgi:hypothetical protein